VGLSAGPAALYRKGGLKMGRKGRKRLELWLPDSHFIWGLPKGSRATFAVSCLDLVPVLSRLEKRLAAIEDRLARLEEAVRAGPGRGNVRPQEETVLPDPDSFLAAFE